jgi:hypothetical protein
MSPAGIIVSGGIRSWIHAAMSVSTQAGAMAVAEMPLAASPSSA